MRKRKADNEISIPPFPIGNSPTNQGKFLFSRERESGVNRFNNFSRRLVVIFNRSICYRIKTLNRYTNAREKYWPEISLSLSLSLILYRRTKTWTRTLADRQFVNSLDSILKRYSILRRKWCKTALERKWRERLGLNERTFVRMSDSCHFRSNVLPSHLIILDRHL